MLIIKEILVDMWTPLSIYSNQIICSFHLGANEEFSPFLTHDYKVGVAWNEIFAASAANSWFVGATN